MALTTTQFPPIIITDKTVTITAGQTVSEAADLLGTVLIGILTTDTLVGGSLSFESSIDGAAFFPVYNDAAIPLAISIKPDRFIALDITDFASMRFIKVVSDATETSDVAFQLLTRPAL